MSLFGNLVDNIVSQIGPICEQLETLPIPERIEALNKIRQALHQVSPFADQPIDCVLWEDGESVQGNDYNPNKVFPPEMRLLKLSIDRDGYTQPVVVWDTGEAKEVVDGEHRSRVGKEVAEVKKRLHGYLPVTVIKSDRNGRNDRMAATIRHNRARGVHGVMPMTDIVAELIRLGWDDDEVAKELGMDADEVLRFKHNSGLAELFVNGEYSQAWE